MSTRKASKRKVKSTAVNNAKTFVGYVNIVEVSDGAGGKTVQVQWHPDLGGSLLLNRQNRTTARLLLQNLTSYEVVYEVVDIDASSRVSHPPIKDALENASTSGTTVNLGAVGIGRPPSKTIRLRNDIGGGETIDQGGPNERKRWSGVRIDTRLKSGAVILFPPEVIIEC